VWEANHIKMHLCYPVDEEDDEDEEEEEEEEEEDGVGRVLRCCWLCGMPRCADR
jgi:hypothetical protein